MTNALDKFLVHRPGCPGDKHCNCGLKEAREDADFLSRLDAENDKMLSALWEIYNWGLAYPLEAFPEPDYEKSRIVLEAAGLSLSCISADCMRHVVTRVSEIAKSALPERLLPHDTDTEET